MTPQERLRKHQRALEKTQRELDRERVKLENQEKKLVQDIRKSAKNGQMGACKIQAKDLVRTRRYLIQISGYLGGLLLGTLESMIGPLADNAIPPSGTLINSTRCAPNSKLSPSASKPSGPMNR